MSIKEFELNGKEMMGKKYLNFDVVQDIQKMVVHPNKNSTSILLVVFAVRWDWWCFEILSTLDSMRENNQIKISTYFLFLFLFQKKK